MIHPSYPTYVGNYTTLGLAYRRRTVGGGREEGGKRHTCFLKDPRTLLSGLPHVGRVHVSISSFLRMFCKP